ncbi:MAG: heavy metal transport/detoxification protein [Actinophytocola sp.]|uniref:heavy-metal-associated domain-containing protein n=1 Tax=Actinophytocola sp. TaxID=1872138 RepID=UPI00132A7D90|nr:cation transporter [Actinophytocola sp.]MPZ83210.1 heavy metal transport/detoxification protein [Actinophytocola sp.]
MTTTTFSVPEISCDTCKNAIEGAVGPVAGVETVQVDVSTKTVTVHHDDRAPIQRLVEVIEDQGYDVAGHR